MVSTVYIVIVRLLRLCKVAFLCKENSDILGVEVVPNNYVHCVLICSLTKAGLTSSSRRQDTEGS
uniref:Uncharacterized protein n=1 Tax=Arundo donax TaxID=35708 RepID=A0A0A9I1I7_ARUDO